jgi:hypothetical protein
VIRDGTSVAVRWRAAPHPNGKDTDMINAPWNKMKTLSRTVALAAALVVTGANMKAFAASSIAQDTVNVIEYTQGGSFALLVQLNNGVNYTAFLTSPGCNLPALTIDTVKAWQSLAQSALLAGKKLKVYFNVCGGANVIETIDLLK